MASIVKIKNIFEPITDSNRLTITPRPGTNLALYMHGDYIAVMNNKRLPVDYVIKSGDLITITPVLRGGGGGKQVLSIVAMVALITFAPYMAAFGTLMLSGGVTMLAVINGAVLIGGSMLINSLLAPDTPAAPTMAGIETSPTYSWAGAKTRSEIGNPIPVVYGTVRLPGNVINSATDHIDGNEYLRLQLALCHGPVKEISKDDVLLNGTALQEFTGPDYPNANPAGIFEAKLGTYTQTASSMFLALNSSARLGLDLTHNVPVTRTIPGSGFTTLEVILKARQGIYYINTSNGAVIQDTAAVKVEFREAGSDDIWAYVTDKGEIRDTLEYEVKFSDGANTYCYFNSCYTYDWYLDPNLDLSTIYPQLLDKVNYPNAYAYYTGRTRYKTEEIPVATWFFAWGWTWAYPEAVLMVGDKTKPVTRNIRIPVDPTKTYEIRVTKQDPDSTEQSASDTITWDSINGLVAERLNYPGIANLSLDLKATDQINTSPNISTLVTRDDIVLYDEFGEFVGLGSSNIPAWALWDLLTNEVYGGGIPYTDIDFATFQDWAQWSQEVANNGRGELLPRAEFNGVFDYNTNLWEAISKIALAGRASVIIRGTKYSVVVDKPTQAVQTFTMGNIIADSYSTSYTPIADIATEVEVQFINKDRDYTQDQISVQIPEFYPVDVISNKTTVSAMGITSAAEAYRWGRYLLATSKYQRRHITFDANIDSIACNIGDVINFAHDVPQWGQSGRIIAVDYATSAVTLDKTITTTEGLLYNILIRFSDDTAETLSVTNPGTGEFSSFVIPDLVRIPDVYDVYTFGEVGNESKLFRISSISRSSELERTITASEYNESIINDDTTILPAATPFVRTTVPILKNVVFSEHLEKRQDGTIIPFITVDWELDTTSEDLSTVVVYVSNVPFTNYEEVGRVLNSTSFTIQGLSFVEGVEYYFKFQVLNSLRVPVPIGSLTEYPYTYLGKIAPPSQVENFTVSQSGQNLLFSWDEIPDIDAKFYEIRRGVTWAGATILAEKLTGTTFTRQAEFNGTFEYLVKAIDSSGVYSTTPTSVVVDLFGITSSLNAVITGDAVIDYLGVPDNMVKVNGKLLSTPSLYDTTPDVVGWVDTELDYLGDENNVVSYTSEVLDTFKIGSTSIRLVAGISGYYTTVTDVSMPLRFDITFPNDTDTSITAIIDSFMYIRYSADNIVWSDWEQYTAVISKEFRFLQFKCVAEYDMKYTRIEIDSLKYILDVPDVEIVLRDFIISAAGESIIYASYGEQFYMQSAVQVTVQNATRSLTPDVTNKTLEGCTITLYDATDTPVAGVADIIITGY